MTLAAIDQLAQLLHQAAQDYDCRHRRLGQCVLPWERLGEDRREMYRWVARAVLKKLGR